jgi:hypothetical protein
MRSTIVKGKNDRIRIDLGSDVDIICHVMNIGKCLDYLIYEVELNGQELIAFLDKFKLSDKYKMLINVEFSYVVTAYDW